MKGVALSSGKIKDAMEGLDRALRGLARSGAGLGLSVTRSGNFPPRPPLPLVEPEDMRIVTPTCHPGEPVKIVEDWNVQVHCLICGSASVLPMAAS